MMMPDLASLDFASPLALLALPLPLLAVALLRPRGATSAALRVPASILLNAEGSAAGGEAQQARRAFPWLAWAAWIALVVALAGPQTISASVALPMSGRDLMLVLDVSGSMEAKDFTLDGQPARRLDVVKAVTRDFLRRRAGDRIGLVFFAENAELAAVPTFDIVAIQDVLADTEIGMLGRSTAIGDGLGLALKGLKDSSSASKVVVLLSDGANTAGIVSAQAAAQLARTLGVRVHSIALGSDTTAGEGAGEQVDAAALEDIAATAGGEAFRVRTTDDLRTVTAAIDTLEPTRIEGAPVAIARELWPYPAAMALLLCLAGFAMGRRT
jgi:Ca-activated chloride channel family protein